ncbi:hypothetical protein EBT31_05785 [bacterium]|jgi:hypothetical protein|nr:hypothetical protein [bacterium]
MRIEIDSRLIEERLEKAFERYSQLLEGQFTKEISTKQFTWPSTYKTRRGSYNRKGKGRESVGSPRDIVDSGALRQSIVRSKSGPFSYRYTWNVDYSLYVLRGYRTQAGNQMPARDWISPALNRLPITSTLQKLVK